MAQYLSPRFCSMPPTIVPNTISSECKILHYCTMLLHGLGEKMMQTCDRASAFSIGPQFMFVESIPLMDLQMKITAMQQLQGWNFAFQRCCCQNARGEYFGKIWRHEFQGRSLYAIGDHSKNFRSLGPTGAEIWPFLWNRARASRRPTQTRPYLGSWWA